MPRESSPILSGCSLPVEIVDAIKTAESGSSFTAMIIKVKRHYEVKILAEIEVTKQELANIYHFHLYPNDLPDTLMENRFQE